MVLSLDFIRGMREQFIVSGYCPLTRQLVNAIDEDRDTFRQRANQRQRIPASALSKSSKKIWFGAHLTIRVPRYGAKTCRIQR